jgi:cytochrome oxidase assembly protein ShyY1
MPAKLKVILPDNYLQYALTWYGLAGVLVISGLLAPGRSQAAVGSIANQKLLVNQ